MKRWAEEDRARGKNRLKQRALNSEAIIKQNMERDLEGTSELALCILMEC